MKLNEALETFEADAILVNGNKEEFSPDVLLETAHEDKRNWAVDGNGIEVLDDRGLRTGERLDLRCGVSEMSNQAKIEIAQRFVELHKKNDVEQWQPLDRFGDDKYRTIYHMLASGEYGNVKYNDPDDLTSAEIEIGNFESVDGTPKNFEFEVEVEENQCH